MAWNLYILQSQPTGIYYVGITENLSQRLEFHNLTGHGFTARYRPWKLVYHKDFTTRQLAQTTEKQIKNRKSREYIRRIVEHLIEL
jgi:putative endonuclease